MEVLADRRAARRRRGVVTAVNEQLAVGRVHGKLFGGDKPLPRIGKYEILQRLGEGSMGTVYLSRDPHLDRHVAVKLYRPRHDDDPAPGADERLWREAQLLARVAHPNVVAVHEVGRVGHDDTVFVAMEHVHGVNLSMWLEDHPEADWRRVVELVEGAARGLAAVHAAGILHRDLKPSNILVGDDGRVRVLDFGLARLVDGRDLDPTPKSSPSPADTLVSSEGVVGTPAYMAPEQHENEPSSVSTDLYALCVALFEALFGHRPFEGKNVHALWKQKVEADIDWSTKRGKVPRSLRRVLRKGLQPAPAARFQTADGLVRALARVRRRTAVGFSAAAAVALVAGAALGVRGHYEAEACAARSQALGSAWTADAAANLRKSFSRSAETEPVAETLEAYASGLVDAGASICALDAVAPGELDARWACLDARSAELDVVVGMLRKADKEMVAGARDATAELLDPRACLGPNAARLSGGTDLASDQREQYRVLASDLARAQVLHHSDRHGESQVLATSIVEAARDLQSDDLIARTHYLRARTLERLGRYGEAEEAAEAAILAAERASDPALAARSWSTLISTVGAGALRFKEALAHEVAARAALSRLPDVTPADVARLESALAVTQAAQGDHVAAADRFERVLQHEDELTPRQRMAAHRDLASMYNDIGLPGAGLEHARQAHDIAVALHGAVHPEAARMLFPVVGALRGLDRSTEAVARGREAMTALEASRGDRPTRHLVLGRLELALAFIEQGNLASALEELQLAQGDADELGVSASVSNSVLLVRGRAACDLGRHDDAVRLLEKALTALRASPVTPAADELVAVLELARCERERGDLESARRWTETADSIQFPGETPGGARIALLEERARLELASERAPDGTIAVMAQLVRRLDRPTSRALLEVLRAHAAATRQARGAAKRHADAAQQLLAGTDSRRARLLRAEVDPYLRPAEEPEDGETAPAPEPPAG